MNSALSALDVVLIFDFWYSCRLGWSDRLVQKEPDCEELLVLDEDERGRSARYHMDLFLGSVANSHPTFPRSRSRRATSRAFRPMSRDFRGRDRFNFGQRLLELCQVLPKPMPCIAPCAASWDWQKAIHEQVLKLDFMVSSIITAIQTTNQVFPSTGKQVSVDRPKCKIRYTSEVYFASVTQYSMLKDRIPFHCLDVLDHCWDWEHGMANVRRPLRTPSTVTTEWFSKTPIAE